MLLALALTLALTAASAAPASELANFTGYIVTAQWDGRTIPTVQWALDVTRQDIEYRFAQELKLQKLIPTTPGNALSPTYTAYDAITRTYFTTVAFNNSAAFLFGMKIANDVGSSTPFNPVQATYSFPVIDATLVGLEIYNSGSMLTVLALFMDGTMLAVNPATGATSVFGNFIADSTKQKSSTAITLNAAAGLLYAAVQSVEGSKTYQIVTFNLATKSATAVTITQPKGFITMEETAFETQWLPTLNVLMVFYTGSFDQLIYTDPKTGASNWAVESLMDNLIEFYQADFLEDDDTWSNSAYDAKNNLLYFQCTEVSQSDDETTTALCHVKIESTQKNYLIPQINISPMTYGYAGLQYVQVVQ